MQLVICFLGGGGGGRDSEETEVKKKALREVWNCNGEPRRRTDREPRQRIATENRGRELRHRTAVLDVKTTVVLYQGNLNGENDGQMWFSGLHLAQNFSLSLSPPQPHPIPVTKTSPENAR